MLCNGIIDNFDLYFFSVVINMIVMVNINLNMLMMISF